MPGISFLSVLEYYWNISNQIWDAAREIRALLYGVVNTYLWCLAA